ncbi:hypothetical protein CONCODRAFT_12685 [Conidiobolus coronatus NRRL 28638]|uniref:DUF4436 domain-containing protein n=1 Tax=Conidiobolus coronatus (strain ATCC 28846 / CBS 209.66 / NRRL 28638) TaxID=796925 RepID=A0A137NSH7_CONC2|nr:hypothetical protein CONCODRAFT_12685 [Conidiobolus coronatus NRRL 28638]|eukprot:KXN65656.1 hypothetical protein CONCODRAFT_12685 [Conidiobolus coronatus NRRL 28638]
MKSILQSSLKRRILFSILGLILWCAIAIPTLLKTIEYGKSDELKAHDIILHETEDVDRVDLDFRVLSTDLAKRTMRVYLGLEPHGAYSNTDERTWNKTVEFQFLHKNLVVKKGSTPEPITFEIPLQTGNLRDYPFDKYATNIWFIAIDNSTRGVVSTNVYSLVLNQNTNTRIIRESEFDVDGIELQIYNIYINRTPLVYAFCFFISVVTWGLTIVAFNIALDSMIFKRELPPPLLAIGITMLFAMPTLRKAQPDIPEIGCAIDFLCFIWCEVLIGISSCMILYSWLLRYKTPWDK